MWLVRVDLPKRVYHTHTPQKKQFTNIPWVGVQQDSAYLSKKLVETLCRKFSSHVPVDSFLLFLLRTHTHPTPSCFWCDVVGVQWRERAVRRAMSWHLEHLTSIRFLLSLQWSLFYFCQRGLSENGVPFFSEQNIISFLFPTAGIFSLHYPFLFLSVFLARSIKVYPGSPTSKYAVLELPEDTRAATASEVRRLSGSLIHFFWGVNGFSLNHNNF